MSDIYLTNRLTYFLSLPPRTLSSSISQASSLCLSLSIGFIFVCFDWEFSYVRINCSQFCLYKLIGFVTICDNLCVCVFDGVVLGLQWCCRELQTKMEHGSYADNSNATFSLTDEDHTLANAVRFSLNQESVLAFLFLSQYFIFICMFQFF